MCNAKRRCPGDKNKHKSQEWRNANNAKRRQKAKATRHLKKIQTNSGYLTINPYDIDNRTRNAYLTGQCFGLAHALTERLPGSTMGVMILGVDGLKKGDPMPESIPEDALLIHAVAITPDGTVWDIDGGIRNINDFEDEMNDIHPGAVMVTATKADLKRLQKEKVILPQAWKTAAAVAATVERESLRCENCGQYADATHMCTPSADDFWNETYISDMSEELEEQILQAYGELEETPPRYFNNCEETSALLHEILHNKGIESRIVNGSFIGGLDPEDVENGMIPLSRDHVWLEVDGNIIDPTAGQFRREYNGEVTPEMYLEYPSESPQEAVGREDYRMTHKAPTRAYGASADRMDSGEIFPSDFYKTPDYYSTGNPDADREVHEALMKVKGNPDAIITVYRAAPQGKPINPGDWVSLSRAYAEQEGIIDDDPANDLPVHSMKVRAGDLYCAGDIGEYGWDPSVAENNEDIVRIGAPWPVHPPHPVTGYRLPRADAVLPSGQKITISESGDGVGRYGYNGRYAMYDETTGEYMGHLDYQSSGNKDEAVLIAMVEVEPKWRRSGVADALVARLAHDYPQGVTAGMLTDDGAKWWKPISERMGWK